MCLATAYPQNIDYLVVLRYNFIESYAVYLMILVILSAFDVVFEFDFYLN